MNSKTAGDKMADVTKAGDMLAAASTAGWLFIFFRLL